MEALHIASTALRANEAWIGSIAHNIANLQTPGFKRVSVQFSELVHQQQATAASVGSVPNKLLSGLGTRLRDSVIEFGAGSVQPTGVPTDVAIQGNGFFEVVHPDTGELVYTRVGRLTVNAEGQLALRSGHVLSGAISVPPDVTELFIASDGTVKGRVGNSTEQIDLGELTLARVLDPGAMRPAGDGFYAVTEQSGEAATQQPGTEGVGTLLAGHLEGANVDLQREMTELVMAQRAYQLNARIIQTAASVMETMNNLERR